MAKRKPKQKLSFQQALNQRVTAGRIAKVRAQQIKEEKRIAKEYPSYNLPYDKAEAKRIIQEKEQFKSYQKKMETPIYKETISRAVRPAREIGEYSKGIVAEKYSRIVQGESRAKVMRRARATSAVLSALGATAGGARAGAGRPVGSYNPIYAKYGGVMAYRKAMQQRKILYQQYQMQQQQRFAQKGFTPAQVQELQQRQVIQEMQPQTRVSPSREGQFARPQPTNVADEELAFRKFQIQQQVSPNTQRILDTIRRIQNKGKMDVMEQSRRHFERNLVGRSMNMFRAHENLVPIHMDFTKLPEGDLAILDAPSVFKEQPENFILRKRARSVLDMQENNLRFFG